MRKLIYILGAIALVLIAILANKHIPVEAGLHEPIWIHSEKSDRLSGE